jgi:hypothetical protein
MNIKEKTVKQTNDAKRASPDGDMPDSADEETAVPAEISDDAGTQPPKDPDDPLTDPQVKAGFEKLKDLVDAEGDVEVEMGRELNRVNEALKGKNGRHGRWGKILKDELGIGYKKASRARAHAKFHAWAEETDNLDHLSKIPRSACYLLGGPRTTDVQREDAIRRATEDGSIDIETVKRIVHGEGDVGDPESPEDRTFRCLAEGFKRWLKKFKEADEKNQDRVINEVRKRHREFVASICPPSNQTEKPKA